MLKECCPCVSNCIVRFVNVGPWKTPLWWLRHRSEESLQLWYCDSIRIRSRTVQPCSSVGTPTELPGRYMFHSNVSNCSSVAGIHTVTCLAAGFMDSLKFSYETTLRRNCEDLDFQLYFLLSREFYVLICGLLNDALSISGCICRRMGQ